MHVTQVLLRAASKKGLTAGAAARSGHAPASVAGTCVKPTQPQHACQVPHPTPHAIAACAPPLLRPSVAAPWRRPDRRPQPGLLPPAPPAHAPRRQPQPHGRPHAAAAAPRRGAAHRRARAAAAIARHLPSLTPHSGAAPQRAAAPRPPRGAAPAARAPLCKCCSQGLRAARGGTAAHPLLPLSRCCTAPATGCPKPQAARQAHRPGCRRRRRQ
jgi:hypothetical protein